MKNNEYLYGEGIEIPNIPKDIANNRIDKLYEHLNKRLDVFYPERDNRRINDIMEAIKFWKKLRDGDFK